VGHLFRGQTPPGTDPDRGAALSGLQHARSSRPGDIYGMLTIVRFRLLVGRGSV
jgi:hypothetical protein